MKNVNIYKVINKFNNNAVYVACKREQKYVETYLNKSLTNADYLKVVLMNCEIHPVLCLKEAVHYISENWVLERTTSRKTEVRFTISLNKDILKEIIRASESRIIIKQHFFEKGGLEKELNIISTLISSINKYTNNELMLDYAGDDNRLNLRVVSKEDFKYNKIRIEEGFAGLYINACTTIKIEEVVTFELK